MSGSLNLAIQFSIDVYPYEGGQYTLSDSNSFLLGVNTQKNLYSPYGTFSISLSPGGPTGTTFPTWTQILTPYSFVIISAVRGGIAQTIMFGLVLSATEQQQWTPNGARRMITVQGADIGFLFADAAYYNLAFLYGSAASALGGPGMLSAQSLGLIQGTPASMATTWFTKIMAGGNGSGGADGGILSTMKFNINGQTHSFSDLVGYWFEEFNGAVDIPLGANFLADQGSWLGKFQALLQSPWYEFFVTTAPSGTYSSATEGTAIQPKNSHYGPSEVFVIGRVNPLPFLTNSGGSFSMNTDKWQQLTPFDLQGASFLSSSVSFSAEGVRNFYLINPAAVSQLLGAANGNINPFLATQVLYKDQTSIDRYGYKPEITETQWFYDPDGVYAQGHSGGSLQDLYKDLLLRVVSMYEPAALMARASVTMPLRPDIMIGNVFTYTPFRDGVLWKFYIEGVSHDFGFGDAGSTALTLGRGLPATVYNDNALLAAIHSGKAARIAGTYSTTSGEGLTSVSLQSAAAQNVGFSVAQGGKQPQAPSS